MSRPPPEPGSQRLRQKFLVAYMVMFILPVAYLLYVIFELSGQLRVAGEPESLALLSLEFGIPASIILSFTSLVLILRPIRVLHEATTKAESFVREEIKRKPTRKPSENDEAVSISSYVSEMIDELRDRLADVDHYAQDLHDANQKLVEIAINDGLTNLYNHKHAQHLLSNELERAKRFGHPLSVFMLDVDGFKSFNDTYGHVAGDKALAEAARLIKTSTRNIDIVSRYGGEEFLVIVPETLPGQAAEVAHRVRDAVALHEFETGRDGEHTKLTVSIGVAAYTGVSLTPEELVGAADENMYKAKDSGKNCVFV